MKAIHGEVTDVRQIRSQGVARIYIEVPIEATKEVIAFVLNEKVFVTQSDWDGSYGVVERDDSGGVSFVGGEVAERYNHGDYARKLHAKGFFRAPKVWAALGTDEEYQAWCREHACAVCGDPGTVFAHVRRVHRGAGMGIKPEWSGLPLCDSCHTIQHNEGYSAVHSGGLDWFEKAATRYVEDWAHARLVTYFGAESLTEIQPDSIIEWAQHHDCGVYLPRE